jgi:small conductance mechanosensitive channel
MSDFFDSLISQLKVIFDPEKLASFVAEKSFHMLVALILLGAFYLVWVGIRFVLSRYLPRRTDPTTTPFVTAIVKYLILAAATMSALDAIGIKTSSVLATFGVAGLTIGFAARDAFSNLISGVLIYLDRPFVIGDLVEVDGKYGRVDQITLRSTRIVTVDGKMLAVPNSDVINKTVTSYTNFPHLRLDIRISVAVTENLARVRTVLLEKVTDVKRFMQDPSPKVVVTAINDYNAEMELQVWIYDEKNHIDVRFQLREDLFNALNAAGIVMPYETIQLAPVRVLSDKPT